MTAELAIIAKLEDQASKGLQSIEGNLKALEPAAGAATQGFSNLQSAVKVAAAAGVAAMSALVVGAGALAVSGTKAFMSFQDGMNEVFTLLPGQSEAAYAKMEQDVMDFGVAVGRTSDEIIPALYQSISAGVPQENVFSFLETAHAAALGGATELETAVDGISSVVNAYGSEIMDATQASDLMFTAVKLGKTDFGQLSASLSNVTPLAAAMKIQFGDVSAALATMTSQGTKTKIATTQLRSLFQELGTAGTEVSNTFTEIAGVGFLEFIEGGGNVSEALQMISAYAEETGVPIQDLFGNMNAGIAAMQLTGANAEKFADNLAAMGESAGATEEAYAKMNEGLARGIEVLGAMWDNFKIQVGAALEPIVRWAVDILQAWAGEALPGIMDGIQGAIDSFIQFAEYIGLAVSGAEGAKEAFANLDPALRPIAETVLAVVDAVRDFIDRMNEGVSVVGNIKGLVMDLATAFGASADEAIKISGAVGDFVAKAQEVIEPVAQWVQENVSLQDGLAALGVVVLSIVVPAVLSLIGAFLSLVAPAVILVLLIAGIRAAWEADFLGIRTFVETTFTAIVDTFNSVKDALSSGASVTEAITQGFITFAQAVGISDEIIYRIIGTIKIIGNLLSSFFGPSIERVKEAFAGFSVSIQSANPGIEALKSAFNNILPVLRVVAQVLIGVLAVAVKLVIEVFGQLLANVGTIFSGIANVISGVVNFIAATLKGLVTIITKIFQGDFKGAFQAFQDMTTEMAEAVVQIFTGLLDAVVGIVRSLFDAIMNILGDLTGEVWGTFDDFIQKIIDGFMMLYDTLVGNSIIPDLVNGIISWFEKLGEIVDTIGQIWDNIIAAVEDAFAVFQDILAQVDAWLSENILGWDNFKTAVTGAWDNFKTAVSNFWGIAETVFTAIKDFVTGEISWDQFKETVVGAWDGIKEAVSGMWDAASSIFDSITLFISDMINNATIFGTNLGGAFDTVRTAVETAKETIDPFIEAVQNFGNWLMTNVFSFKINLPDLPDWAIPGSPIPLHTAWKAFGDYLSSTVFELAVDFNLGQAGTIDDVRGWVEDLKGVAEMITAVTGTVGQSIFALNQLSAYTTSSKDVIPKIEEFREAIFWLVRAIASMAYELEGTRKMTLRMAEIITEVVTGIEIGITAMSRLQYASFPPALYENIDNYADAVKQLSFAVAEIVQELEGETLVWMEAFADGVTKLFEMVGTVLDGTAQLSAIDFSRILGSGYYLRDQFTIFRNIVRTMMRLFSEAVAEFGIYSTEIEKFAAASDKLFGMIEDVLLGSTALSEFDFSEILRSGYYLADQFKIYRNIVRTMIRLFLEGTEEQRLLAEEVEGYADAAARVFELIGLVLEGSTTLSNFDFGGILGAGYYLRDQFTIFRNLVRTMITLFAEAAVELGSTLAAAVQDYTDAANSVFEMIPAALEAIEAIMNFEPPPVFQATQLTQALALITDMIVQAFQEQALAMSTEVATAVETYVAAAESVLGLVEPAINGIAALMDFEPPIAFTANVLAKSLALIVDIIVQAFADAASDFEQEVAASITWFTGAANEVMGLIQPAIDGIAALLTFEPPSVLSSGNSSAGSLAASLARVIDLIVQAFEDAANDMTEEVSTAIQNFASAAEAVLGLIQPAIDGIAAIGTYVSDADLDSKIETFKTDFLTALTTLRDALDEAGGLAGDALDKAAVAAGHAQGIFDIITPAIDALNELAKYEAVKDLDVKLKTFSDDLKTAVSYLKDRLNEIAQEMGEGVISAISMAQDINTIFNEVQTAADSLAGIANSEKPDVTPTANWLEESADILDDALTSSSATLNGTVVQASKDFAKAVDTIKTQVYLAVDGINQIINAKYAGTLQSILDDMVTHMSNAISPSFSAGQDIGDAFSDGLMGVLDALPGLVDGIIGDIIAAMSSGNTQAYSAGQALGQQFASGLMSQQSAAESAARAVGNAAGSSLSNALNAQKGALESAARAMAAAAVAGAEAELQIGSPSKVFTEMGVNARESFWRPLLQPQINATSLLPLNFGAAAPARGGDNINVNISVNGDAGAGTIRNMEQAVRRGLYKSGQNSEARRRR